MVPRQPFNEMKPNSGRERAKADRFFEEIQMRTRYVSSTAPLPVPLHAFFVGGGEND
jgi:hypothetical protein